MYESGWSQNKRARRLRDRRAKQWSRANKTIITSSTPIKSLAEILCSIWWRSEPGWTVIRAYCRGAEKRSEQLWLRTDEISPKRLERWLDAHRAWHVEFCPITFQHNWEHLSWHRFEFGAFVRWESLPGVKFGPIARFPNPDVIFDNEDKALWFTKHELDFDFRYEERDGLFIWLPTQRLSAIELIKLYRVPIRRDLRHYGTDRSTLLWRIGKECVRKGMRDPDDIKTIIRASTAFQSRLEERGERSAERSLDADVRKLLREAP